MSAETAGGGRGYKKEGLALGNVMIEKAGLIRPGATVRNLCCDSPAVHVLSDAAPRLLQENQRYLSQLTSLMQEAADEQSKSIVVSSCLTCCCSHTVKHVFRCQTFQSAT